MSKVGIASQEPRHHQLSFTNDPVDIMIGRNRLAKRKSTRDAQTGTELFLPSRGNRIELRICRAEKDDLARRLFDQRQRPLSVQLPRFCSCPMHRVSVSLTGSFVLVLVVVLVLDSWGAE